MAGTAAGAAANGPGSIVFVSWRGGAPGIYSVRGDGSGPVRRIAAGFPSGTEPSWSRDGKKLAFSVFSEAGLETNEIWASTPTGGSPQRLTAGKRDEYPAWSPNRRQIAFIRNDVQLWVMNSDGSAAHKLLYGAQLAPAWAPNGRTIAFTNNGRLFTSPRAAGKPKRIGNPVPQRRFDPVFSPDGSRIAFEGNVSSGHSELFVMRSDGTHVAGLTTSRGVDVSGQPSWSPDGRFIAYSGRVPKAEYLALFLIRADGAGTPRQLTHPIKRQFDLRAAWSPNGKTIVFARGQQLWTIPSKGGREHILRPVVFYGNPDWTPGGSSIAVNRSGPGTHGVAGTSAADVYLLPAGGGTPRKADVRPGQRRRSLALAGQFDDRLRE